MTDRAYHCGGERLSPVSGVMYLLVNVCEGGEAAVSYTRRSGKRLILDPPADDPGEPLTAEDWLERVYGRRG